MKQLNLEYFKTEVNEDSNPNKWKKYLDKIEKALAEYKECESTNCSCYKE